VLAPAGLLAVWAGGALWAGLVMLFAAGGAAEWAAMCEQNPRRLPGVLVPLLTLAALGVQAVWPGAAGLGVLLAAAVLVWAMAGQALAAGPLYLGAGGLSLLALRQRPAGLADLVFLLLVVWSSDIGAYLAGRLLGGARLAPAISPGKTWSGAVGGLVAAMLAGIGVALAWHAAGLALLRAGLLGLGLGVVAEAGDLLESAVKRHFGRKDSGRIIPGHGGLLDRLDALLAAAPAALLVAMGTGQGAPLWS
jgi:phosphatidate cytidylyltransferase